MEASTRWWWIIDRLNVNASIENVNRTFLFIEHEVIEETKCHSGSQHSYRMNRLNGHVQNKVMKRFRKSFDCFCSGGNCCVRTYLFPSFASVATLVSKSDMLNFDVLSLSGCVDKSSSQMSPEIKNCIHKNIDRLKSMNHKSTRKLNWR